MSPEQQFYQALYNLRRNYPNTISTWGRCCNDYCENDARGSGYCADCSEEMLAEVIGSKEIAAGIHQATKEASDFITIALERVYSRAK